MFAKIRLLKIIKIEEKRRLTMKIGSKEHQEILENFEKNFSDLRLDKEENKQLWRKGIVYQNGETNKLYNVFILGYGFARVVYL